MKEWNGREAGETIGHSRGNRVLIFFVAAFNYGWPTKKSNTAPTRPSRNLLELRSSYSADSHSLA